MASAEEKTNAYLERVSERYLEEANRKAEAVARYRETFSKYCFLLNSGAILAFPTFAQSSGLDVRQHVVGFCLSIGGYSIGLIAALITIIFASVWYRRMEKREENISEWLLFNWSKREEINEERRDLFNKKVDSQTNRVKFYFKLWAISGATSLAFFVFSTIVSGLVIAELDLVLF